MTSGRLPRTVAPSIDGCYGLGSCGGRRSPDTSTTVLGLPLRFPVVVAPWAYQRLAHPEGELATARAAAGAGTVMVVSSTTESYLEEVADGERADPSGGSSTSPRIEDSPRRCSSGWWLPGYGAICWTVDFPVNGLRHRDTRSGFVMPIGIGASDYIYDAAPHVGRPGVDPGTRVRTARSS